MTATPKTLEEGVAALAAIVDDKALAKAAGGEFGHAIRLLSVGEKVRREQRKKRSTTAA